MSFSLLAALSCRFAAFTRIKRQKALEGRRFLLYFAVLVTGFCRAGRF